MKILTILGTRPEIIRLSQVIPLLDTKCEQILVNTGQSYDTNLSGVFFDELAVREPDYHIGARGSYVEQIATILVELEKIINMERPDRFLVLGDTNSSLGAITAKRQKVPVYHMEAGNRCWTDESPEEVNRRVIDHSSDILLPYTQRSRENLLREGIHSSRIHVIGNPIYEVLEYYDPEIKESTVLQTLGIPPRGYFLVTLHREENVDDLTKLTSLLGALHALRKAFEVEIVISTHPRTRERLEALRGSNWDTDEGFHWAEPFGFFDFVKLEVNAGCVLTDSGTVQEECCIKRVRNVVLRDHHERPEAIDCGSAILAGTSKEGIVRAVKTAMECPTLWDPPPEYLNPFVSSTVAKILLGH